MTVPASSLRRSTIDRMPVFRRVPQPAPRRKLPRWVRRLLLLLLLALLLALALVSCHESKKPRSLADSELSGVRLVTGPICLEEAVDVSGSMTSFRAQRELAEQELFRFARRALLPDDRFSEAFFASSGTVVLPPVPMATLTAPPGVPASLNYNGTLLAPAVDALVRARSTSRRADTCASRALLVITDGLIQDDPDAIAASLRRAAYTRIFAVIPSETGWHRPDPLRGGAMDSVTVYHFAGSGLGGRLASVFADAKPLDVVFGDIVGALTGQHLQQEKRPT